MKKKILIILALSGLSTAVLCADVLLSRSHKNGFERSIRYFDATEIGIYGYRNETDSVKSLIFLSDSNAWFSTQDPYKLFTINLNNRKRTNVIIHDPSFFNNVPKGNFCIASTPDHYQIFRINYRRYLSLNIKDKTISEFPLPRFAFTRCVSTGPNNVVFRRYNSMIKDQQFCMVDLTDTTTIVEKGVSEKHRDWGLRTDGILLYDKCNNLTVYVYYKKNSYLIMDPTLKLIRIGKTILNYDKPVKYNISRIHDAQNRLEIVTESVPATVSVLSADIYDGNLYICSGTKADNETRNYFDKNCVIDVYRVGDTKYLGSFYIARYQGKQLWSFVISNNKLFAAYETGLKVFSLPDMFKN